MHVNSRPSSNSESNLDRHGIFLSDSAKKRLAHDHPTDETENLNFVIE